MKKRFLFFLLVGLVSYSCEENNLERARLNVLLVDKPADYKSVNVEVLGVEINYGKEGEESGWTDLDANTGIYDLLTLTAGNEALLVSNDVQAGTISQVRLVLGDQNSVVNDEGEFELKTPSGQSSGLKLNIHQDLIEGLDYTIVLDFDVSRSVLENPVKYMLKPVIRASLDAQNGAIKGIIDPNEEGIVVYAMQGEDIITSTYPDESGLFLLRGLEQGAYTVSVDIPDESIYEDLTTELVEVEIGEITDLGTLELLEK